MIHCLFIFLVLLAADCPSRAASTNDVVVLANRNVPESMELARYYVAARGLDPAQILPLDVPASEAISRDFYEVRLRDPLLAFLRERGLVEQVKRDPKSVGRHDSPWSTLRASFGYIVSMYGVPVRIADTRSVIANKVASLFQAAVLRDGCAVDSELSLLLQDSYEIRGRVPNPAYNLVRWEDQGDAAKPVIVATRLDGPDAMTVRRMIDDSVATDRYGVSGRCYFDSTAPSHDDYLQGDYWIVEACARMQREGYECYLDQADPSWGPGYPMEDAAYYLGWYLEHIDGPFRRPGFSFRPGAFAYHLHSSSTKVLRQSTNYWAGPLLSVGAAATMGAVGEPYLRLTPDLQILTDRLASGGNFGRSAYMSLMSLSWQITVVGDPLYAPFRLLADEQIANMEKDGHPDLSWAYLRKANLLVRDGRLNVALNYLREKRKEHPSLVLSERIADLYAANGIVEDSLSEYAAILKEAKTAETAVRVAIRLQAGLRVLNRTNEAEAVISDLFTRWKGHPALGAVGGPPAR